MVVVGGEFGCGGGCWPVAWWWQDGFLGFSFLEQGFWVFLRGVLVI